LTFPLRTDQEGAILAAVGSALYTQGQYAGHGRARGHVGIILWRDPDRLVGAAAAFLADRSLPVRRSPEGYLETIPDLVVEVLGKNDTLLAMLRKMEDYLQAGVRLVWLVEPETRTVTAYRPGRAPEVLGENDTLTAEDIIPAFPLAVRDALAE
jgi:Uma2 family endonuclease